MTGAVELLKRESYPGTLFFPVPGIVELEDLLFYFTPSQMRLRPSLYQELLPSEPCSVWLSPYCPHPHSPPVSTGMQLQVEISAGGF